MDMEGMMVPTATSMQPVERAREAVARDRESLWFPDHGHLPTKRETPAGGCAIGRDPASVMHGIVAIGP